uniref:BZIP domain-containing protein n=1 Tax=Steinernema glaseri TaxID=37863 RepID=A0A1I7YNH5_9BILA
MKRTRKRESDLVLVAIAAPGGPYSQPTNPVRTSLMQRRIERAGRSNKRRIRPRRLAVSSPRRQDDRVKDLISTKNI